MKGHDWGILALRLTAIYLFVQALYWGGTALLTFAALFADFDNIVERPWNLIRVEASALAPMLVCYGIGLWYWKAAPRITAPIAVTDERPSIADERIAPVLIAAAALWGSVNLVPALRAAVWALVPIEESTATV